MVFAPAKPVGPPSLTTERTGLPPTLCYLLLSVTSEEFVAAVEAFLVGELPIKIASPACERLEAALKSNSPVLVGEIHGVAQNPLIAYTLMHRLRTSVLALEWPPQLQPMVDAFSSSGLLDFSAIGWSGDGRITAGHFAVIRQLRREGSLHRLVLFDPFVLSGAPLRSWSDRDDQMATLLLAGTGGTPALVMAGNLHTQLRKHEHGVPMGVRVAGRYPGTVEVRIRYLSGRFFNMGLRRVRRRFLVQRRAGDLRLGLSGQQLELTIPVANPALTPRG